MNREMLASCYTPAALKVVQQFPVDVEHVELVEQSENVTYRVSVRESDTDYVLRLHRPGYNSIEELNSERMWTRALREGGIAVQDSLRSHAGRHFEQIDIPTTGEQRYAGMATWLEGRPLRHHLDECIDVARNTRLFHRVGQLAASIHNQSAGWETPAGFKRHSLDLEGLLGEAPYWGRFWEHPELTEAEKQLLRRARERVRATISTLDTGPDNFGLIHADLHPDNIICTDGDLALIDFDDAAFGWHLYDLAAALIEDRFTPHYDQFKAGLLAGYREHRALAEHEEEMLDDFLLIRGMAIIGWFYQRPEHAGAAYFEEIKAWVLKECAG